MLSAKNIEESHSGVLFRAVVILSSLIVRRPCCATVIDTSCPPADGGSTLPLFIRMWHPFVKALFLAEVLLRGASLRRHGQRLPAKIVLPTVSALVQMGRHERKEAHRSNQEQTTAGEVN